MSAVHSPAGLAGPTPVARDLRGEASMMEGATELPLEAFVVVVRSGRHPNWYVHESVVLYARGEDEAGAFAVIKAKQMLGDAPGIKVAVVSANRTGEGAK